MRILLVHNFYGSEAPSGENRAFEMEVDLLQRRGHDVRVFSRHSDELRAAGARGLLKGAFATPWNPWSVAALRREVDSFKADLVHAHNTFPLISPAIFNALSACVPRVLTLHNYRLFCAAGIPMRDAQTCTECLDARSSWSALQHGCYRGSRFATLPLAFSIDVHRWLGTWRKNVDAFIALTAFQREIMVNAGLPDERVVVKPNFYPGNPQPVDWDSRRRRVVFVGRLSEEKGVADLVASFLEWGEDAPELIVVGDGPLRGSLESHAAASPRIRFVGAQPLSDARRWIAESQLLVLPSICFEGFPMVLQEAFAFGTPMLVSDAGPLPGIVSNGSGALFKAGDPVSLRIAAAELFAEPSRLEEMGVRARGEYESKYREEINYQQLLSIFKFAAASRAGRIGGGREPNRH